MSWVLVGQAEMRDLLLTVCRTLNIPHRTAADDQPKLLLVQEADAPLMNLMHKLLTKEIARTGERFYVAAFTERLKDAAFSRALMSAYMLGGLDATLPMLEEFLKPQGRNVDE